MSNKRLEVLDHGFVELVDYMGSDQRIVDAARVSIAGDEVKPSSTNRHLIRYLLRNRHCYHPNMEVLTARGWVRWEECNVEEDFLVPDPVTKKLKAERLPLEVFDADEEMITFKNNRMSFCVTPDHRMWYKSKGSHNFGIVRAEEMHRWGHFDPLHNYSVADYESIESNHKWELVGFYLGDGSYASMNRLCFRLKKDRKKEYLRGILNKLTVPYTEQDDVNREGVTTFYVETPDWFKAYLGDKLTARSAEKGLSTGTIGLTYGEKKGLLTGLLSSDGHLNNDKNRWEFSSASRELSSLVTSLFCDFGFSTKETKENSVYGTFSPRTSLESRPQYYGSIYHRGKVYCATTSTGLLVVRGNRNSYGFICGNTTPFETVTFTFAVKAPIALVRQWMRHRSGSFNEMSARYGVLPEEYYVPEDSRMNAQAKDNHQGSADELVQDPAYTNAIIRESSKLSFDSYHELINTGLARETARMVVPVNTYTQFYWTVNLWNLMHFLKLRLDGHAQAEIRQYAQAILHIIQPLAPIAVEAFEDYILDGVTLSKQELTLLKDILREAEQIPNFDYVKSKLGSVRETNEFIDKFELETVIK